MIDASLGSDAVCVVNRAIPCASLAFAITQPEFAVPRVTFVFAAGRYSSANLIFMAPLQRLVSLEYLTAVLAGTVVA